MKHSIALSSLKLYCWVGALWTGYQMLHTYTPVLNERLDTIGGSNNDISVSLGGFIDGTHRNSQYVNCQALLSPVV